MCACLRRSARAFLWNRGENVDGVPDGAIRPDGSVFDAQLAADVGVYYGVLPGLVRGRGREGAGEGSKYRQQTRMHAAQHRVETAHNTRIHTHRHAHTDTDTQTRTSTRTRTHTFTKVYIYQQDRYPSIQKS